MCLILLTAHSVLDGVLNAFYALAHVIYTAIL